jgi:hypothetical protein
MREQYIGDDLGWIVRMLAVWVWIKLVDVEPRQNGGFNRHSGTSAGDHRAPP